MCAVKQFLFFGLFMVVCTHIMGQPESQLIVVSFPGRYHEEHYKNALEGSLQPILDMFKEYSYKVEEGGDIFMILYHPDSLNELSQIQFHDNTLFKALSEDLDLWMRDFTNILPDIQVKFSYRPDYLTSSDAEATENEFLQLLTNLKYSTSTLILDGGNVVDNGYNKVVITKRAVTDNIDGGLVHDENDFKDKLAEALRRYDVKPTVCLLEDQEDSTGHSDGLVSFLNETTIFVGDYNNGAYQGVVDAIKRDFGDSVDIIRLPCYEVAKKSHRGLYKEFTNADGAYINMLVTDEAVYVPQFAYGDFGKEEDADAMDVITREAKKCNKKVLGVNTGSLAHMGGNVRCMSWQMYDNTEIATSLISSAHYWPYVKNFAKHTKGKVTKQKGQGENSDRAKQVDLLRRLLNELENMGDD